MRVLVTRPAFDAARTAQKLSSLGHEALIDSVIEIVPLPVAISGEGISAIVFTSANAIRVVSAREDLKRILVFAVGARTAEAAREHGFASLREASGDVNSLGDLIAKELPRGARVLHIAGEDRAGDLAGRLARDAIAVETCIVYRARAAVKLRQDTVRAFRDGQIGAVLHYSERSAASFVRLAEAAGVADDIRRTRHLCLSSAVAGPLKSSGAAVEIAAAPDETALLALLGA